ncbi:reverse transcriptase domain-containing protein [Tanacetum coccineum]
MQTRSSSKIVGEPSTNPTSTILKRRNRRRSIQRVEPFSLVETPVVMMADQRTMEQLLHAPTEGYGDAIVILVILAENYELKHGLLNLDLLRACPPHGFTELHQLDTFYNALTPIDQDSLNAAAGGNLLTKTPRDALTIIENKSKVRNSRNKPVATKVSTNAPSSSSTPKFPKIAALADAVKALVLQRSPPSASVKAVEEICVTCGGPHPYYQCLATDGNVFLKYRDNIQGYVSAAATNYNQGNTRYRPQGVANQIRPPGFAQPNVQNNPNRFNQGYNQNRGNNQGNPVYQAPVQQTEVAPSNEFSNYKKMIDTNIKSMQNQINNVKNELRNEIQTSIQTSMSNQTNELRNMMVSFFQMNTASTSCAGPIPSNTIVNPRGDLKAITTQSGVSYDRPPIPPPSSYLPKVVERVPEVTKDTVQPSTKNIQPLVVQTQVLIDEPIISPNPKPTIPYPLRVNKQKLCEKDNKLALKFLEIFRKLHFELSFADALLHMPKFATMFKCHLNNKEKLFDLATTPVGECLTLADLGTSINLMPLFIWKKLSLPELTPIQMILELADRSTTRSAGIAEDVFVKVGKFHFLTDFVVVDYVVDPRVPLILRRPFLRTGRALIDVYGEELTLRHDVMVTKDKSGIWKHAVQLNLDSTKDLPSSPNANPLSGSTTYSSPSLRTFEISDYSLEEFADELALIESFPPGNDDMTPEDVIREIEYLLNRDPLYSPNNDHIYTIPEMFTNEHTLDYSSHPRYDDADDDLFYLKTDNDEWGKIFYDDPFDSKENKIKVSKLLVDELDSTGSSSFLPHFLEGDSVLYGDFFEVNTLTSTDNEDKVINPGILIDLLESIYT